MGSCQIFINDGPRFYLEPAGPITFLKGVKDNKLLGIDNGSKIVRTNDEIEKQYFMSKLQLLARDRTITDSKNDGKEMTGYHFPKTGPIFN